MSACLAENAAIKEADIAGGHCGFSPSHTLVLQLSPFLDRLFDVFQEGV